MMVVVVMVLVTLAPSQASIEAEEGQEWEYQPRVLSSNCFSGDLRVLMIIISAKTQS